MKVVYHFGVLFVCTVFFFFEILFILIRCASMITDTPQQIMVMKKTFCCENVSETSNK